MSGNSAGPRCVALVGPYLSGKTTLLESLLYVSGAVGRRGTIKEGNTVGDSSPEARGHQMSTELTVASYQYLDDPWTVLDAPGSIEFIQDAVNAAMVADAAVVVCDPDSNKAMAATPLFKFLDDHAIPHMVFINKIDEAAEVDINAVVAALRNCSERPLVLRHVPIREGGAVTGYIDLASERAYAYKDAEASARIDIPESARADEEQARQDMLESLADYDDTLLEALLEDQTPSNEEIYQYLTNTLQSDEVVPVFIGSGLHDHGVRRLLKALRHETPGATESAKRAGFEGAGEPAAQIFKTYHMPHAGKQSVARIWSGEIADGTPLNGTRVSGIVRLQGHDTEKLAKARAGEVVAFGRMEPIKTGDVLTPSGNRPGGVFRLARSDHAALRLRDCRGEARGRGQAAERHRQADRGGPLAAARAEPRHQRTAALGPGRDPSRGRAGTPQQQVPSRRGAAAAPGRLQGDDQEEASSSTPASSARPVGTASSATSTWRSGPCRAAAASSSTDKIVGGAIPQATTSRRCEKGVKDYPETKGPARLSGRRRGGQALRRPVSCGRQLRSWPSRRPGRMAMSEGMPKCEPVLLEPIYRGDQVSVPQRIHQRRSSGLVSGRRGQILGFEAMRGLERLGLSSSATMPQAELHDLVVDLRSLTLGVGSLRLRASTTCRS